MITHELYNIRFCQTVHIYPQLANNLLVYCKHCVFMNRAQFRVSRYQAKYCSLSLPQLIVVAAGAFIATSQG